MLPVATKPVGRTLTVAAPLTVPADALTVIGSTVVGEPTATAAPGFVASLLICTVPEFEELHVTACSCWFPPAKVPVAMNRWYVPGEIVAVAGVVGGAAETVMDVSPAGVNVPGS
jgi:hypothetical protein